MQVVLIVFAAVFSPLLGLALLLWLAHLEDTLPQAVQRAGRTPDPAPILAIPVRSVPRASVLIPTQREEPAPEQPPLKIRSSQWLSNTRSSFSDEIPDQGQALLH